MLTLKLKSLILLLVTGTVLTGAVCLMSTQKPFEHAKDHASDIDYAHGNSDENMRKHIVYEIFQITPMEIRKTLKYGISSQDAYKTKSGNPRPEYQVRAFRKLPDYRGSLIDYIILYRNVEGRKQAKSLELMLVGQFFAKNNRMPEWQLRPVPVK